MSSETTENAGTKLQAIVRGPVTILDTISPGAPKGFEDHLATHLGLESRYAEKLPELRGATPSVRIDEGERLRETFSSAEQRLLATRIECARRELDEEIPLFDGERETEPLGTGLLAEAWRDLERGTPIVTRRTNFATVHEAHPHLSVSEGRVQSVPLPVDAGLVREVPRCWDWKQPFDVTSKGAKMLWSLSRGLVLIPEVGAILSVFFAELQVYTTKDITWDDVFKVAYCAADEVSKQNEVAQLKSAIGAMGKMITDTYLPAKKQIANTTGADRTHKQDRARDVGVSLLTSVRDNLGSLSAQGLGREGLMAYVAGAAMVVALYQELCTVDSATTTPEKSSFFESMRSFAREAVQHVDVTIAAIVKDRGEAIQLVEEYINKTSCTPREGCVIIGQKLNAAHWVDKVTGQRSSSFDDKSDSVDRRIEKCRADMAAHSKQVLTALRANLEPLHDAAQKFLQAKVPAKMWG